MGARILLHAQYSCRVHERVLVLPYLAGRVHGSRCVLKQHMFLKVSSGAS